MTSAKDYLESVLVTLAAIQKCSDEHLEMVVGDLRKVDILAGDILDSLIGDE